jgi:ribosomal protein S18 acetylase RimI-like enzyme/predicted nucleic acid-binding protein
MTSNRLHIEWIDQNHSLLPEVMALGKRHSATLGFMPDGGFEDHARRRNIIVASENGNLQGYLMYRVGQRNSRISIVHLCVREDCQGKNLSTRLLDTLRDKYKSTYSGIALSCRKDYQHASKLWERYGFVPKREIRSKRSIAENYLNIWWYDFNQPDLFSAAISTTKIQVLLDSNIILKLRDQNANHEPSQDPRALLDDWLADEIDYYYAPEILNEINRDKNKERVQQTRAFLNNFTEARADVEIIKSIANELVTYLPGNTENHRSDRTQLATAIVGGIPYFVTFDTGILDKKDEIEEKYSVSIYSPQELILAVDQLLNRADYSPSIIAGVSFHSISRVTSQELNALIDLFLNKANGEKKHIFNNEVLTCLSGLNVIKDGDSPIAFYAHQHLDSELVMPFMRLSETKHKQTLFMHLMSDLVNKAIKMGFASISFGDSYLDEHQDMVLRRIGFDKDGTVWRKELHNKMCCVSELASLDSRYGVDSIFADENRNTILAEIERKLFPIKFSDLDIPTYVIPIKAYWAGQLFDHNISGATLFGASPDKLWNIENVYYRNTKPLTEIAPARILWYVSADKNVPRSKCIVASSYLNEVMTGKPKELYRSNRYYGIYEWRDVFELCKHDVESPIRALKFSHTEVFESPVAFTRIQKILIGNGRKENNFQSPVHVSKEIFNQLYTEGKWGRQAT